ncbi:MAG: CHAT domain-containing protein, partial [Saprospiraceae bacterium]
EKKRTAKAPHSDYIEYCVTDSYLYSLSSIGGHSQFVQLGRKSTFDSLLVKFNSYVELKNLNTNDTILRQLDKILIEPVSEVLPDRIVLIPEGDIGLVPFEMLKNACGNYRIEESAISYMYQYEPYMYENLKGTKKSAIFCLAPNYGTKSGEDPEVSRGLLYSLPYAKNEIDSIYRLFGWGSRRSESGDKKEWLKNIRATKIFHYAGHAVVRKDQAYLALSNSIDKPSQLTDSEIGQLHNPLDMVVLSACETGLGKFESGEGIRSLGRSFMEAGAAASIYSLWSINDRSTASFMSSFYKYLQKGMRKDEALRQCKLDFILHSSKFRHPYYWAAFIGAGDMEPLEIKNKRLMIIGGLCIFMMLLIAFALYFSKNK